VSGSVPDGSRCQTLLLSALGGAGGALMGIAVTSGYAGYQDWPAVVPVWPRSVECSPRW
jgi:putative ABC transport system permease protein